LSGCQRNENETAQWVKYFRFNLSKPKFKNKIIDFSLNLIALDTIYVFIICCFEKNVDKAILLIIIEAKVYKKVTQIFKK